jgi:hypothetical protein
MSVEPRKWPTPPAVVTEIYHDISERTYIYCIGGALLNGVSVSFLLAAFSSSIPGFFPFLRLLAGTIAVFAGVEWAARTKDWRWSLAGSTLTHAGVGLLFSLNTSDDSGFLPMILLVFTGIVGFVGVGVYRPVLLRGWGSFVVAAFFSTVIALTLENLPFWPWHFSSLHHLGSICWIAFLDYYWTRAMTLRRSFDTAMDVASAPYLDAFNQIIRFIDRLVNR